MPELHPRRAPRRWPGGSLALALVGVALVLFGAGGLTAAGALAAVPARVLGANVPVNPGAKDLLDLGAHNSPSVVRNPVDGANLAEVNRIDLPRFACALHVSSDGGATWPATAMPPPGAPDPTCYAPDAAFGADGTLYVVYVTLEGVGNVPAGVWLTTSGDGGRTMSPPTRVLGPRAFQVRLVADPAVASQLYLTWLQADATATVGFPGTGYPVSFARSDDGGRTWHAQARVSDASRQRVVAPSPAAASGGALYVLYLDLGEDRLDYAGAHGGSGGPPYPGPWSLVLARSSDGGVSWEESIVDPHLVPTNRFVVFTPPFPSLAVDRSRVYASFYDGRLGDADVWVWASEDRGETFTAPTRVNDTAAGDGRSQYLPKLAAAPGGRVDVVYYDRRADADNSRNEVSLQSSFDGARSFGPRLVLSDRPFDAGVGPGAERHLPELGSRLGLVSTERGALAVWTDTRAGTSITAKQDIVAAAVAVRVSGLSRGAQRLLYAGAIASVVLGLSVLALASRSRRLMR